MPDMTCPVCGSEDTIELNEEGGLYCIPGGHELTGEERDRLSHNARVAEAAEWLADVHEAFYAHAKGYPAARECEHTFDRAILGLIDAVRAARDCRGKEGDFVCQAIDRAHKEKEEERRKKSFPKKKNRGGKDHRP